MVDVAEVGLTAKFDSIEKATAALDKMSEAAAKTEKQAESLEKATASSAATTAKAEGATKKVADATNAAAGSLRKAAEESKAASAGLGGMSASADGLANSLSSGDGLLGRIVEQMKAAESQGGETTDAFGGIKESLGEIFSPANIATVAVSAFSAAALMAAKATLEFSESQDNLGYSLAGVGRQTGLTVSELGQLADEAARSAEISISSSRDMAAEFARAGAANGDIIRKAIELTDQYADVMGMDATSAARDMARALEDPQKGVEILGDGVGGVDAKTREYIETLLRHNDVAAAQATLLGEVAAEMAKTESNATNLGKTLKWAGRQWSDFWHEVGRQQTINWEPKGSPLSDEELLKTGGTYNVFGIFTPASQAEKAAAKERDRVRKEVAGLAQAEAEAYSASRFGQDAYDSLVPNDKKRKELKAKLDAIITTYKEGSKEVIEARKAYDRQIKALDKADAGPRASNAEANRLKSDVDALTRSLMTDEQTLTYQFEKNRDTLIKGVKAGLISPEAYRDALKEITDTYAWGLKTVDVWRDGRDVGLDKAVKLDRPDRDSDMQYYEEATRIQGLPNVIDPARKGLAALQEHSHDLARDLADAVAYGDSLGDAVTRSLRRIAAEKLEVGLDKLFGKLIDYLPADSWLAKGASWLGIGNHQSYDGGGYTGNGPRSGGLDGKGGFWAVMHPRETVIDHTKGQAGGGNSEAALAALAARLGQIMEDVAVQAGRGTYERTSRNMNKGRLSSARAQTLLG